MTQEKLIHVKIYRGTSEDHKDDTFQDYAVPHHEGISVLEVLDYIYKNFDSSLSFYFSCRIGKCLGCYVEVDGKVMLACAAPARDNMTIGPHKKYQLIKDLMVDFK